MPADRNEANVFIMSVLLLGIFIGSGINIWLGLQTFIFIDTLFHIAVFIGLLALGVHYLFFRHWNRYFAEILAYSILGWGNIGLAILLCINYFYHETPVTEQYRLNKNVALVLTGAGKTEITVTDTMLSEYPHMLIFSEDEINGRKQNNILVVTDAFYTTANGLLGYKILLQKQLK
ncbi:MAG: hypothetical protein ACXWDO_01820 [Bacteroidia bacterium]